MSFRLFGRGSIPFVVSSLVLAAVPQSASADCPGFSGGNTGTINYSYPYSIGTADVNGDGKQDLLVIGGNDKVDVFFGDGNGGFSFHTAVPVGAAPRSIVTGDFNRDGKIDFATANSNDSSVSVFLGNGDGTFTQASGSPMTAATVTSLIGPFGIAAADINGDGKLDLAVANQGGNAVTILLGVGDGTFTQASPVTANVSQPVYVALGDLDGDGKMDLVVANTQSNIVILHGDGTGAFPSSTAGPTGPNIDSTYVTIADLNGDGRPDIITTDLNGSGYFLPGTVQVYLQNANGTFAAPVGYGVQGEPVGAMVADFNGDGKPDIAAVNSYSNSVSVLLGVGDGTFGSASNFTANYGPNFLAVADFNGDGKPDIATANYNTWDMTIFLNNSDCATNSCARFGPATSFTAGNGPGSVVAADFNRDGKLDVAVGDTGASNVAVLLGDGAGGFGTAKNTTVASGVLALAVADFNGDGIPDVAAVNTNADSVSIVLGNGDGTFATHHDFGVGTSPSRPRGIVVGDFNGDGKPDLAVTCGMSLQLTILLNTTPRGSATPSFTVANINGVGSGFGPRGVSVGDFNRDGKLDVAVANFGDGTTNGWVTIFLGKGDGTFFASPPPASFGTGVGSEVPAVGDFNGDGKLDLAVPNFTAGTVTILLGDGAGGFSAATGSPYTVGASARNAVVADINHDGKLDVATSNGDGTTSILLGSGTGTFTVSSVPSGTNSFALAAGDFNRDGAIDLVVADNAGTTNNLSYLRNGCPDLAIAKSHTGNFVQGQVGATYTINVTNPGSVATGGTVTVTDTLPTGLTATNISGTNWNCTTGNPVSTCTRSDALAASGTYEPITVTVTVANSAASSVVNNATVSGGGESNTANDSADDATTVDPGLPAPANLTAFADSVSTASVSWSSVTGATGYKVFRSFNNQPFAPAGTTTATTFPDSALASGTTYVYAVEAMGSSSNFSPMSNVDIATTIVFTDDPIGGGTTAIKAVHLTDLRTAVNAVRTAAGLPAATFTGDPLVAGSTLLNVVHITQLRAALDEARAAIGVPPMAYTDPTLASGDFVKAAHVQDLRTGVK